MKRVFSILLAAVLLMSLSVQTLALCAPELPREQSGFVPLAAFDGALAASVTSALSLAGGSGVFSYADVLNERERDIYDSLAGVVNAEQTAYPITQDSPIRFTYSDDEEYEAARATLSTEIVRATSAFVADHARIFWISGYSVSWSYVYDQWAQGNRTEVAIVDIVITFAVASQYASNLAQKLSLLDEAVAAFEIPSGSTYQKVRYIHDALCENVVYDLSASYAHEPVGALLEGRAVCEGYAEAMKLLCEREGIVCLTVTGVAGGGGHMWNAVQMDDGALYLVDATWDDQSSILYDYLLVGTETPSAHFPSLGETFADSHVPTGEYFSGAYLPLPTFSESAYPVISGDVDGNLTVESADLLLLAKRIAGWDLVVYEAASDRDADGAVSSADLLSLARRLAGWSE